MNCNLFIYLLALSALLKVQALPALRQDCMRNCHIVVMNIHKTIHQSTGPEHMSDILKVSGYIFFSYSMYVGFNKRLLAVKDAWACVTCMSVKVPLTQTCICDNRETCATIKATFSSKEVSERKTMPGFIRHMPQQHGFVDKCVCLTGQLTANIYVLF